MNFFNLHYLSNIEDKFTQAESFTLHMSTVGGDEENTYLDALYDEYKNNPDKLQGYYFNLYKLDNDEKQRLLNLINSNYIGVNEEDEIVLNELPKKFELSAITIDLGYSECDFTPCAKLCEELGVPYKIVKTDIAHILFEERKESNPCSLCAKMRKGALNDAVKEMGCNKVAYAHHKDDIIETMLLSLIFEGRFHSFSPKTYLDRMDLTEIRPMMYVDEMDVIGFQHKYNLPVAKSRCPIDGLTKREYAKDLVKQLNTEHPGARNRMFTAILNGNIKGWPECVTRED
jgi:hypothetical protein